MDDKTKAALESIFEKDRALAIRLIYLLTMSEIQMEMVKKIKW